MTRSCRLFGIAVSLQAFSLTFAAGVCSPQSVKIPSTPDEVTDFVAPGGRVDLESTIVGEYEGVLKLDGPDVRFDPGVGEALFRPSGTQTAADHPDDIYWDNSLSASLPGANGYIYAMTVYGGGLVVCGEFSVIGDVSARNIAIWNGSSWSALGEGIEGSVRALSVYHDQLIAAGQISSADGQPVQNIAAWDGTSWSSLGESGPADGVVALTVYEDRLIAAGYFVTIGSDTVNHIASWDGSAWSPLGSGINAYVYSLVEYDHKLYAGGAFAFAGGVTARSIASWDGTTWAPLGAGIFHQSFGGVTTLTVFQNKLIAGGWFYRAGSKAANSVASWDGTSWSALTAGISEEQLIRSLVVIDNKLVAAGLYEIDDVIIQSIQYWDGTAWSPWEEWGSNHFASTLSVYNNKLVATGNLAFPALDYQGRFSEVSFWDGSSWKPYYGTGFNSPVDALTVYRDNLIAAGSFTSAGGIPINHIASWNGSSWSPLGSGLSAPGGIRALEVYEDKLYAAGSFSQAGNEPVEYIASWDGSNWSRLGETGLDTTAGVLVEYNGELIVGGAFTTADGKVVNHIAAWDGDSWEALGPGLNGEVLAITVFQDTLIAAGYFSASGSEPVGTLVRWDGTNWSTVAYPDSLGPAIGLSAFRNKLIGVFRTDSGGGWFPWATIASRDGSFWTPLPERWYLPVALTVYDGDLIAAGYFTTAGSAVANNIARWDGSIWESLGSGMSGGYWWGSPVYSMTVYNGDLIAGGNFTTAGGKLAFYLAAWTKHEARKVVLDIKPGSCVNPINGNSAHGQGKAVLPVAIMGTADFDVHDIDPATITLNGSSPVRWNSEDVGAPPDDPEEECPCSEAGPDGFTDLTLKFYSAEIVASLAGENVVRVAGQLYDGTPFEGQDCVTLVGNTERKAVASDIPDRELELVGNHPNPFNPTTMVAYSLPSESQVAIEIFNVLGQRVRTLVNETMPAGSHQVEWNGTDDAGRPVSTGVYLYRIQAGDVVQTKKMLLIK